MIYYTLHNLCLHVLLHIVNYFFNLNFLTRLLILLLLVFQKVKSLICKVLESSMRSGGLFDKQLIFLGLYFKLSQLFQAIVFNYFSWLKEQLLKIFLVFGFVNRYLL